MAPAPVLLLTHAFPPVSAAEAPLAAKRMGALRDREVDVVCTGAASKWVRHDPSLENYVRDRFRSVVRVEPPRWPWDLRLWRIEPLSQSPDIWRFANRRLLAAARRRPLSQYGAIVSWSQWHSVHLAALRLVRDRGAPPWLAHFSDPWSTSPFLTQGRLTSAINRRLELRVLRRADRLLFTSQETVDLMLGDDRALRAKARVLPHAYDPALIAEAPGGRADDGRLVLRYTGQFYEPRSPEPLFEGLAVLLAMRPELRSRMRVEVVGNIQPHMLESKAARSLPHGLLEVREPVPYVASLGLIRDSDVLLVVDAPMEVSPFLPSKLIDYIGARRPVVGITPRGASRSLIDEFGGWTADPRDPAGIAAALEGAIDYVDRAGPAAFGNTSISARYCVERVGHEMSALIDGTAQQTVSSSSR